MGELFNQVIFSSLLDRLVWMLVNSGVLTSKNFYAYPLGISDLDLAWKRFILSSFIPPSRLVFFWRLFLDWLPIDNKFIKLGFNSYSRYSLCLRALEDALHSFYQLSLCLSCLVLFEEAI